MPVIHKAALGPSSSLHWKLPSYITPGRMSTGRKLCSVGVSYIHFPKPELNYNGLLEQSVSVLVGAYSTNSWRNLLLHADHPAVCILIDGSMTVVRLPANVELQPESSTVSCSIANLANDEYFRDAVLFGVREVPPAYQR